MAGFARVSQTSAHQAGTLPRVGKPLSQFKGYSNFLNSQSIWFEFAFVHVVVLMLFSKTKRCFFSFNFLEFQSFAPLLKTLRKSIQSSFSKCL